MKDSIRANIPFYITDFDISEMLTNASHYVIRQKEQDMTVSKPKLQGYSISNADNISVTIDGNTTQLSMAEFMQKIISFLKEQNENKQDMYLFYDEWYNNDTIDHNCIEPQQAFEMVLYAIKKS